MNNLTRDYRKIMMHKIVHKNIIMNQSVFKHQSLSVLNHCALVAQLVCLFVIYLFEQVEVLAAIQHKGQPQHRRLHPLLFWNGVWVL